MKISFSLVRDFFEGCAHFVLPNSCWICSTPLPPLFPSMCDSCQKIFSADPLPTCPRCSSTIGPHAIAAERCLKCHDSHFAFSRAYRLGQYEGKLREVILRCKSPSGEGLGETVAAMWAQNITPRLTSFNPQIIVPVPLHWSRLLRRGFNQSEILARHLSQVLKVPCLPRLLRRRRRTAYQAHQRSLAARLQNVHAAFAARDLLPVAGKNVLLVDDVLTTGATASEAAAALRPLKPAAIGIAVVAHGN